MCLGFEITEKECVLSNLSILISPFSLSLVVLQVDFSAKASTRIKF